MAPVRKRHPAAPRQCCATNQDRRRPQPQDVQDGMLLANCKKRLLFSPPDCCGEEYFSALVHIDRRRMNSALFPSWAGRPATGAASAMDRKLNRSTGRGTAQAEVSGWAAGAGEGVGMGAWRQLTVAHCDERGVSVAVLGAARENLAVSPVGGAGRAAGEGGRLPAQALVEHEPGHGCRGVIALGLRQLLPQRRATRGCHPGSSPGQAPGGMWACPGGPGSC